MITLTKCCRFVSQNVGRRYLKSAIKKDPGINKQRAAVNPGELINNLEELEIEDLESDFMDVQKSYKDHVKEMETRREQLQYHIVKQKYFNEKHPNFLTWNDKEQIKFLHNKDAENWSVEKLSDSFPALPETILKILKGKFTKPQSKVRNHDAAVEKNWENFKKGELGNLPPDLVEHLQKFTERKLSSEYSVKKHEEIVNAPNIQGEFSEIITSYEKLKNKNTDKPTTTTIKLDSKPNNRKSDTDTYLLVPRGMLKDRQMTTLGNLEAELKNKAISGHELTVEEKIICKDVAESEENSISLNQIDVTAISESKYDSNKSLAMRKTERDYSHLIYPEKIVIPDKLKKRGYTYRLNDCYYDYDGQFLYRVPGMG